MVCQWWVLYLFPHLYTVAIYEHHSVLALVRGKLIGQALHDFQLIDQDINYRSRYSLPQIRTFCFCFLFVFMIVEVFVVVVVVVIDGGFIHHVPRTMMKRKGCWGGANRCRSFQTAASWSSSRCRRRRHRRRCRRGSMMARKWWNRRIWLIDFVDFARLCVSLLVLFVGFFSVIFLDRERSASQERYKYTCYFRSIYIYVYTWYISLLYCFSPSYSISRPITRTSLSLILVLSPFSLSERKMYLYIHKSFTFALVTLNCICFTTVHERVSALVRKAPDF